ncbi:hypothetical protein ACHAQD_005658 [Fusarium lateritium]
MDQPRNSQLATEKNKALLSRYGIVPSRSNLLHHQLEGRKYFDSGDFALTQAHRSSDMGGVTTGSEHPVRQDISEPSSSVPSSSNLEGNAYRRSSVDRKTGEPKFAQHTHLQEVKHQQEYQDLDAKEDHSA